MLIHALVHEQAARNRTFWVALIFFTWILGAFAYSLLRYKPRRNANA
jgi:hypothetical protein